MTKITIEYEGKETVYDEVTDYYLAVRQNKPVGQKDGSISLLPSFYSHSVGDLREIVKEINQSSAELQKALGGATIGNTDKH